ncbi:MULTISPECIES: hypothetical protein [unclassified Curtobacterium]|uniref:hypothetical protein n=1 Tax=unclassified Curtobacterium TaxID=257496 RepID=UPI003A808D95
MPDSTTDDTNVDTTNENEDNDQHNDDTETGAAELGDAGKKALDAMKAKWKTERDNARAATAELERFKAEAESRGKPADEQAIDAARREAVAEALGKANDRIVRTEIRAAAKGKLADPNDAFQFINVGDIDVDDEGNVDTDALDEAITDLLARKPYLAAETGRRFTGSGDQGTKGGKQPPAKPDANTLLRAAFHKD